MAIYDKEIFTITDKDLRLKGGAYHWWIASMRQNKKFRYIVSDVHGNQYALHCRPVARGEKFYYYAFQSGKKDGRPIKKYLGRLINANNDIEIEKLIKKLRAIASEIYGDIQLPLL